ncbi:MAG: AMP-binding protein [Rubrivivax sp.]|nr:AMP-binding protein [Rubrivivax sp.]
MPSRPLILDQVLTHGDRFADRIYLTQPVGGGQVVDYTWAQVLDQSRRMAAHLQGLGFAPGARIAMLSKNCAHFIMTELAIWMAGYTTVAIFPTETAETVRYVLDHSGASLLFVGKLDTWPQQKPGVPATLPCIALPLAPSTDFETWDAIVARTPPLAGRPSRAGDDLAMLLYTSGSTGTPKGVMTSFDALTQAAEGIVADIRRRVGQNTDNRMISYLPLAHSFERSWVAAGTLIDGRTRLYFAETLDTFIQDLQRARPTLFISVPRLWLKFQQGVFAKMPPAKLDRLLGIPLIGRLVAAKIRKGLGLDQVIAAASGSAPIPPDLIRWYRRIGLALYEGYGMTEDSSYSHASTAEHNAPGYVGVTMAGVQVRISPEGEILIKSPGRLTGYYREPELTAACFTEDGFFRTGDLGELRADGLLKITGRAKEIFKTAKGKYVAPAPLENGLNAHPMVEMSLVSGVGQPAAYAYVLLAEQLRPHQSEPAVRAQVQAAMEELLATVNREQPDYAQLRMIVIAREPWSIENGFLTPTMKIKRSRIEAAIAPEVESWFAQSGRVLWQ